MFEVRCNREMYHLHQDMIDWCRENIGPGGWHIGAELAQDIVQWKWFIAITFGNIEFEFVNQADAAAFEEHWNDRV